MVKLEQYGEYYKLTVSNGDYEFTKILRELKDDETPVLDDSIKETVVEVK